MPKCGFNKVAKLIIEINTSPQCLRTEIVTHFQKKVMQ